MMDFRQLGQLELKALQSELRKAYDEAKAQNLKLDMSRGKPCSEQMDLSLGMLECKEYKMDGIDCRNYGGVDGLPSAKALFAEFLEVTPEEVIVGGNSSLAMMYDTIARAMMFGVVGSEQPWGKLPKIKFLCPSPGYDRHFAICELMGIEMITIAMNDDGPDMDTVEKLVAEDDSIKGIWCVPKYSNPGGVVYSDEVVDRLASMSTKAPDFRIFWDNAYTVHHLTDQPAHLKNILDACKAAGNPERVFIFGSTAKITFAGAGVAAMAASKKNIDAIRKQLGIQTIGPDKMNQLRHVWFFKDMAGIEALMKKHAAIIRPKFEKVLEILETELGGTGIAEWSKPTGGYFISLNTMEGCAKQVVKLAAEAGVVLTNAGATYPYGNDPQDRNIRIAPTFPPMEELEKAMNLVALCIKLASVEKLLAK
ncbi:MAG TPA: aminotransferase class I/II-fold pyridoxal phosphate-dependent enzyme [Bacillota bacterium]|nr:aminotransferase class I/II-fold pyridoxal phosphate-dependent enzyme [Bacillota bacterium]HPT88526.1 aminotransferase class I/II-fold pyridoxal phosphate-dependent enzyme [Bacillota bacterium]